MSAAFTGVFELAESNIENDFAETMLDGAATLKQTQQEAEDVLNEAKKKLKEAESAAEKAEREHILLEKIRELVR